MDPRVKRILITLIVLVAAVSIIVVMLTSNRGQSAPTTTPTPATNATTPATNDASADQSADGDSPSAAPANAEADVESADAPVAADTSTPPSQTVIDFESLTAHAPGDIEVDPQYAAQPIGSFDPDQHRFKVELTTRGAGIASIIFSHIWNHALERRQAEAHEKAVAAGDPNPPPMPADSARLELIDEQEIRRSAGSPLEPLPVLAAHSIIVNGKRVHLYDFHTTPDGKRVPVWAEVAPGEFATIVRDAAGHDVLRIDRKWSLRDDTYELQLAQRVTNLTSTPLTIRWCQYGPPEVNMDMRPGSAAYVDTRRFRFGYLLSAQQDPQRLAEVNAGKDMLLSWAAVSKQEEPLWPNRASRAEGYELSWFATTSRYFALAVHPWYSGEGPVDRSLADTVETIDHQIWISDSAKDQKYISTLLTSPERTLASGATESFDVSVYAGPMARDVLYENQPYRALNLGGLIFYQISSVCGFCTFQWLAHILIWFLSITHAITFDWAVAIIILVITVRLLLHPITKRAQVSMHRTMKRMAKFKPEMEKIQQKYANDKQKLQAEQLRLMREHGVNPFGCLGFVPMFLQMPIWVALYAMLYFAYELRHEPAFWGLFQNLWNWQFLADLSQPDHCFYEFATSYKFLWIPVTGINLLPLLMGLVFFIQQKYMTPPTAATMTKEQQQQQKIMRLMMIVLFPLMLYSAPSGLTLYIMTSTTLGIIESRLIRKHAEHLDELAEQRRQSGDGPLGPPWDGRDKKPRKPRDPRGRAYAQMLERMREAKKQPPKTFKKRRKDQ